MGTTGLQRERGMSDRAFFEKEFPCTLGKYGRITACASKPAGGDWTRVFYAAVTNHDEAPYLPGKTWALIILMHTSRNPEARPNFHYKEMDETMGPSQDNCPDWILDLLSHTENRYANKWRERCRAHNARETRARGFTPGQTIRFANPLLFPEPYGEAQRFRYLREGRKSVLEAITDDGAFLFRARIPGWRTLDFEIESSTALRQEPAPRKRPEG